MTIDTWNALNIKNAATINITIYPTFTTGIVYVNNPQLENFKYELYNVMGQLIRVENLSNQISLENFSEGIYFIKLIDGTNSKTIRVIKK